MNDTPCNPCPQVEQAADMAVRKFFAILGVNIDEPKEVEEFRENLRFGATMRKHADRGMGAIIIALAGSITLAVWLGVAAKIRGVGP